MFHLAKYNLWFYNLWFVLSHYQIEWALKNIEKIRQRCAENRIKSSKLSLYGSIWWMIWWKKSPKNIDLIQFSLDGCSIKLSPFLVKWGPKYQQIEEIMPENPTISCRVCIMKFHPKIAHFGQFYGNFMIFWAKCVYFPKKTVFFLTKCSKSLKFDFLLFIQIMPKIPQKWGILWQFGWYFLDGCATKNNSFFHQIVQDLFIYE